MKFQELLEKITDKMKEARWLLLLASVLLALGLIIFSNTGFLPMRVGDLIFFLILTLAFGTYRPGWLFLLLISSLTFENINLVPVEWGLQIRPYQFLALALAGSILIRLATKRLRFKLIFPRWPDFILLVLVVGSFLSTLLSSQRGSSLKFTLILFSFFVLYFIVRNFVQTPEDVKKVTPFFFASSLVISGYGIWQNARFLNNLTAFQVMPGRPNATFTEPDWLGMYLVIVISLIFSLIYYFSNKESFDYTKSREAKKISRIILYFFLILNFILLIITVSRSAWLGSVASIFIFLFIILTQFRFNFREWSWKPFWTNSLAIFASLFLALGTVHFLHLTNFQLFNRAASTASGLQKITIACMKEIVLPEKISETSELEKYACQHINLEDVEKEKGAGKFVTEIYRNDPNVDVRAQIYQKAWSQIKQHPILGIGWGSISEILGKDERGAGLNASNIFLEVWLGSGLIGILAFLFFWIYTLYLSIKHLFFQQDVLLKSIALFFLTAWFGFTVANLFNSGIMLGFLWAFLALPLIKNK